MKSQGSNFNSKYSKTPLTQMEGKPHTTVTKKVVKKKFLQNCPNKWIDSGVFQVPDHLDAEMETINSPQEKYSYTQDSEIP